MRMLGLLAGMAMTLAMPAAAQDYPSKAIRIVVPFGPGTATDIVARTVGAEIASRTGQAVVIDNKPGAEGQIGAQVVMVKNELPAKTIGELIGLARKEPGKLSFGSGNGSSRGGAELFRVMAKIDILGVPYKSQPQAVSDLLGGRIDIIFSDFTAGLPAVLDGRARGIAVTSKKPIPGLEQFPTVDSTVPGFEMWAWTAAYVPAGTPKPIVDKLNALVREALKSEGYLTLTRTTYGIPFPGTPEDLAAFQASETKKWGEIVTVAGMKEP